MLAVRGGVFVHRNRVVDEASHPGDSRRSAHSSDSLDASCRSRRGVRISRDVEKPSACAGSGGSGAASGHRRLALSARRPDPSRRSLQASRRLTLARTFDDSAAVMKQGRRARNGCGSPQGDRPSKMGRLEFGALQRTSRACCMWCRTPASCTDRSWLELVLGPSTRPDLGSRRLLLLLQCHPSVPP